MAVATAPLRVELQSLVASFISAERAQRWGQPVWPADYPPEPRRLPPAAMDVQTVIALYGRNPG
jgi:hypothetical protein